MSDKSTRMCGVTSKKGEQVITYAIIQQLYNNVDMY